MARARVLTTAEGTNRDAFTPLDWGLLSTAGGIWGASFFFIAIGLDHFEPGIVTWGRILFGAVALWSIPITRRVSIDRRDRAAEVLGPPDRASEAASHRRGTGRWPWTRQRSGIRRSR
jgi:drug/metabolite transporter (DMT)-like permease